MDTVDECFEEAHAVSAGCFGVGGKECWFQKLVKVTRRFEGGSTKVWKIADFRKNNSSILIFHVWQF